MTTTLGHLTLFETGAYRGVLQTLNFRGDIEVLPLSDKASTAHPDFRVSVSGVDVGAGWINQNRTTGEPYVSLTIAHPDLGPRAYKVNLGRAADQDDDKVFAMIWNPET